MKHQIIGSGKGIEYDWSSDHIFVKTTLNLSDGRVTVVEDSLKPGFHLPRHHHKQMTEIFYILEGEMTFIFDDETVIAQPGMIINIPPYNWHEAVSPAGAKLLTILSPGGFDQYLAELSTMSNDQFADTALMTALGEKYDTWNK